MKISCINISLKLNLPVNAIPRLELLDHYSNFYIEYYFNLIHVIEYKNSYTIIKLELKNECNHILEDMLRSNEKAFDEGINLKLHVPMILTLGKPVFFVLVMLYILIFRYCTVLHFSSLLLFHR